MITLTCASLLFFLRVVSKNVPIFRPDDGNVAESLSRFNSTFSLKNNTIWHVTDHFYTHNVKYAHATFKTCLFLASLIAIGILRKKY